MVDTTETKTESPKSSPTKKDIDTASQALNHLAQGKRNLLVGDISSAVNSLQEACRLLAEHYGETAPQCAEAYFYYGRALLELARIENGVIGNALDGVPEEEDADSSQVENPDSLTEEGSTEDEENKEDDEDEDEEGASSAGDEEAKGEEGAAEEEGDKTEEDEDVSNLQLAWEMLELANIIFKKQVEEDSKYNLKVAEVYLKLGEVSLENENYAQAVEDLQNCLKIQKEMLKEDNRCIAETHYQIGVAYSFSDEFDKAIESFNAASKVIENRKVNLKKIVEEKSTWTEEQKREEAATKEDPFYSEENEIEELEKLLPEMKEKLTDMEQMKADSKERITKAKESAFANIIRGSNGNSTENPFGASTSSSSDKSTNGTALPVSNISHLMRKKRKPEEELSKDDLKKSKGEDGQSVASATTNGDKHNGVSSEKTETESPNKKVAETEKMQTEEATA